MLSEFIIIIKFSLKMTLYKLKLDVLTILPRPFHVTALFIETRMDTPFHSFIGNIQERQS